MSTVVVETTARLHLGVLDLRASRGRWFGGIGAAGPGPSLQVRAERSETLRVDGEDAVRAESFARRFLEHFQLPQAARLTVVRSLPPHAGLGSGTQLALAVGTALATMHGLQADVQTIARACRRGRRSAVGTWTFAGGGLVVEGGRRLDRDECGPLLSRLLLPPHWRCVVAIPDARPGVHGPAESAAFEDLPPPDAREAEHVAHLVLMGLLPSTAEGDLEGFGRALNEIQEITGGWFAPVQGGTFAPGASAALVREMQRHGAAGVGQSSWGPAVYGIVDGETAAQRLAEGVGPHLGPGGQVFAGAFPQHGARVWRE